ncbi:lipoyl(octanoyl) transferase LipB [filamentous cyanobacterium LEGE 11480]|uniref:Octanoyltransferase n=1 Tax=Romeriopsis navalis LEGE 11480 TaxID=2777977 RepID=A0A928VJF3_9CYAN|nr:lipoyl(octanoyl) transferase LipB [Romeriopsis navalis]MBE9029445.1 lipoyl(octanoyl) transferase LipB [Romeriopsis navalis LEGE 11480]
MLFSAPCELYAADLIPYQLAWDWQKQLVAKCKANSNQPDSLILLEHPAVYTLGQGSDPDFLKFDPENSIHELHRIERGGEVTHHCPGQLVGYPILNLHRHTKDLHWYLRQLEAVIIQVLTYYGLKGERIAGLTGVWVEGQKVAAIGIKVSRWVTMHGFALNVCPDLHGFKAIVPCGIPDRSVGSMRTWIPGITVAEVKPIVIQAFEQTFQLKCQLQPHKLTGSDNGSISPTMG